MNLSKLTQFNFVESKHLTQNDKVSNDMLTEVNELKISNTIEKVRHTRRIKNEEKQKATTFLHPL